jgi:hypothetical protein
LLTHECPQGRRCPQRRSHPASGETLEKSSGVVTSRGVSGWRGQHSSRLVPTLPPSWSMFSTSPHIDTWDEVSVFPTMYMPCFALESKTLIRFEVLRNPHLRCWLHRTSDIMTTLASSPLYHVISIILLSFKRRETYWKLSIVARRSACSKVLLCTPTTGATWAGALSF